MSLPKILISAGEPAGIGPDISLLAALHKFKADVTFVGDPDVFRQRADQLGLDISIREVDIAGDSGPFKKNSINILPISCENPVVPGILDSENGNYVLNVLDTAINACLNHDADAIVTGPIQKSVLNRVVDNFSGHTEYLAEKTSSPMPVMMLATEGLRVALVTTHLPLVDIAPAITFSRVVHILEILHKDLKNMFGIANPRIAVCGLNPHAGEDGHLGREEIEFINPAIEHCQQAGMDVIGTLPADTIFTPKYMDDADAILAMYHDQGLPVLKYKGFGNAINVTLGLPIIRTSVDHGTALDLAGSGKATSHSMVLAIQSAIDIANSRVI